MTSLAILRAAGLLCTGAAGCELVRHYDKPPVPPMLPLVVNPLPPTSYTPYVPLAALGTGIAYYFWGYSYITREQFQKTSLAIQTQVATVSSTLSAVKTKILQRFGIVEKRLDSIENLILAKTAAIRQDLATVERFLAEMGTKVDAIDNNTRACARGVGTLCDVVASNLNNTLTDKPKTAALLTDQAQMLQL